MTPSTRGTFQIVDTRAIGPETRLVTVERRDLDAFAFVGGQYIIIDTGVVLPSGKACKRAYSLMPCPGEPRRARLAVKRIAGGLGSATMHAAAVGAEMSFSGPWGKLMTASGLTVPTLMVATDTGITTALSLVEQARAHGVPSATEVLWLRAVDEPFLSLDEVRARIDGTGVPFVSGVLPETEDPARVAIAIERIRARILERSAQALLVAGDGAIAFAARDALGIEARIESFFHNPERKAG
jgi:ferredoxin-NADP reductase